MHFLKEDKLTSGVWDTTNNGVALVLGGGCARDIDRPLRAIHSHTKYSCSSERVSLVSLKLDGRRISIAFMSPLTLWT